MKIITLFVFLLGNFSHSFSQTIIESFPVSICSNKTTNLIFSYPIKSVDRGSGDVLAQKANGVENVLQVKAAKENFQSTNLSVITTDGKFFSFVLIYDKNPAALNISFVKDSILTSKIASGDQVQLTAEKSNDLIADRDASIMLKQKHFLHRGIFSDGMKLTIHGIYIKDNALWFVFEAENYSYLDYHAEYLRCFIEDKKKSARSAIQETELQLLSPASIWQTVPGKNKKQFVIAFSPFTFSKDKKMIVQMSEKNGGRMLKLTVSHKVILRARSVKP
jgi:conjugative transposon TraN protein